MPWSCAADAMNGIDREGVASPVAVRAETDSMAEARLV